MDIRLGMSHRLGQVARRGDNELLGQTNAQSLEARGAIERTVIWRILALVHGACPVLPAVAFVALHPAVDALCVGRGGSGCQTSLHTRRIFQVHIYYCNIYIYIYLYESRKPGLSFIFVRVRLRSFTDR